VILSRRVLLGTVATATILPASVGRGQQEPIRIGVLNDQSGLYRDFGGPTSVLAARMAVEDFGSNVFGRPIEVIDADHQNKADLASAIARNWFDRQGVTAIADLTNSAAALARAKARQNDNTLATKMLNGIAGCSGLPPTRVGEIILFA